ncbi:hypothetical protein HUT06_23465 [Actinomadura sp. NAK00032]|uniref:hypothetical protein n=1 Tax=Actinomadura sp. NAK00032 TaxID=2742128 RepID=UPI0015902E2A|nr:hypothetical protein [Actinomadura sp. NAK00032]QKW36614.1 hypothetical protein HUT06_23465 [Actinomadura sp. NAK00032]
MATEPDEGSGYSLNYQCSPPGGITFLVLALVVGALCALVIPAMDAGLPTFWLTMASALAGAFIGSGPARRVVLTDGGHLLVTGFGQHVDVEARSITAVSVSRWARLGFGSAVVHWTGGQFRIWRSMRYTPERRHSFWSMRHATGRGGKDFGDLVYRLRLCNPALTIEGVRPPAWALPPPMRQPPHWN